jgi:hypothetical protein
MLGDPPTSTSAWGSPVYQDTRETNISASEVQKNKNGEYSCSERKLAQNILVQNGR